MQAQNIRKRQAAILHELSRKGINRLLVTKPANVTYATGFLGDDSLTAIIQGRIYLITDGRYIEQAQKECPACVIIERNEPMAEAVAKLVKRFRNVKDVTVENSASLELFSRLKKTLEAKIKPCEDIIGEIRSIKNSSEVAAIKKAASIAAKALEQTLPHIKPGITENESAGLLELAIRRLGAKNSFETIVAFGPNASRVHHQPGGKRLKKNDTVLIDFGVKYQGYCCDITRCFAIGKVTNFYQKVFAAVEQAQAAAIKMVKAGVEIVRVDAAAREVIEKSGLPIYGHGTGHGLGLEFHELPAINPQSKGILETGQVITIEPGVYIPGKLGIRIEDDVLVTETGCKILTRSCPHRPWNI